MEAIIRGRVRHAEQTNYGNGADEQIQLDQEGSQLIAPTLPPLARRVSLGRSYWASTTTAAAPVTAIPTTAALIGLMNGENDDGPSYVIDSVFMFVVANTAAIQPLCILANVSIAPVLTLIADTIAPRALLANRKYRGNARVAVGITLDGTSGVAANWMSLGQSVAAQNTPQIGTAIEVNVGGGIVIPPKGLLGLSVLAGAATASSVQVGMRWHEVILPRNQ